MIYSMVIRNEARPRPSSDRGRNRRTVPALPKADAALSAFTGLAAVAGPRPLRPVGPLRRLHANATLRNVSAQAGGRMMPDDAAWAATARELAKQLTLWARERDSPQGISAQQEIARIKTEMCADLRAELDAPPPEATP
jgi:hypothetical protein